MYHGQPGAYEVCAGYDFMPPPPRLLLFYHVDRGIFLRRRRPLRLAHQGRARGLLFSKSMS